MADTPVQVIPPPSTSPGATPAIHRLRYTGAGSKLFGIWITNWLLTIVTLGVYHFWGKTKIRRYFHENILFQEEPFAYLGTGRELFISALKFVGFFVLPFALLLAAVTFLFQNQIVVIAVPILYAVAFYCLRLYAQLSGMRYRANRMSWRGIRFALKVRRSEYLKLIIKIILLNIVTLGLYRPYGEYRMLNLLLNNLAYGSLHFVYQGDKSELTGRYWLNWLLVPFTFGLSLMWYQARLQRHIAKSTRLDVMEFRYNITGGQLFWLAFSNALMVSVSFGLLGAYALQRRLQLFIDTLKIRNVPDFKAIKKTEKSADDQGGSADYLGADEDFGF